MPSSPAQPPGDARGFRARGPLGQEAEALLRRSVTLALASATASGDELNRVGRLRPLVAASIGPYGAFLANGAEYTGDYDLDEAGLREFHRERLDAARGLGGSSSSPARGPLRRSAALRRASLNLRPTGLGGFEYWPRRRASAHDTRSRSA